MTRTTVYRARPRGVRPPVASPTPLAWFTPTSSVGEMLAPLNYNSLLGLPAAHRAVKLIAGAVAQMTPPRVLSPDEITEVVPTPQVVARPYPGMGSFEFWEQLVTGLLCRGNYVGIPADFDTFGYARQVVPINVDFVNPYLGEDGFWEYDIGGARYHADEILHLRYTTLPGSPWGLSPVSTFRQSLGRQMTEQDYAANSMKTSSVPPVVIQLDVPEVTAETAVSIQEKWITQHGNGERKPAVISKKMTVTPLDAFSPQDMEFLSSRQFSVAEMAFIFNLDPSDLGAALHQGGGAITYANVSQRVLSRIVETYAPIMRKIEDAFSDLVPGGNFVRMRPERLMLTTPLERYQAYSAGKAAGALTDDEIRKEEGKPPIPKAPTPPALAPSASGDTAAEVAADTAKGIGQTPDEQMMDDPNMMQQPKKGMTK